MNTHTFEIGDKFVFHTESLDPDPGVKERMLNLGWVKLSLKCQKENGGFLVAHKVHFDGGVDALVTFLYTSPPETIEYLFDPAWIRPYEEKEF